MWNGYYLWNILFHNSSYIRNILLFNADKVKIWHLERDQTEDVCFTMYVYLTKHECIVSERDQTEDACFTMHVYLIKLENSLLLVLCIQQNVRFYL
jgi:hypothetical protein